MKELIAYIDETCLKNMDPDGAYAYELKFAPGAGLAPIRFCTEQEYNDQLQAQKREVVETVRTKILDVVKERTGAGLDDMEAADYKEFLQAEFFVVAMGIVEKEINKELDKLLDQKDGEG